MEEVLKIIALYLKKIAQISSHEDIIPTSVSWWVLVCPRSSHPTTAMVVQYVKLSIGDKGEQLVSWSYADTKHYVRSHLTDSHEWVLTAVYQLFPEFKNLKF